MAFDSDIHHRRSIRLKGYDYARVGAYFVTVCVQGREGLFGDIADGEMWLNEAGEMVEAVWKELPVHYPGVAIDCHVVMPNHFHGIVWVGAGPRACPESTPIPMEGHPQGKGHPQGGAPTLSLPDIVHRFKSWTTARYRQGVVQNKWPPFPGRLWQRNYYERVIRAEEELTAIRAYIRDNPAHWHEDEENPP